MLTLKYPIVGIFQTTFRCNNNCSYCLNIWRNEKRKKEKLGLKEKKEIIDKLVDFKIMRLIFSGGEPLMDHDFRKLVNYSSKYRMDKILQTNGRKVNEFMDIIKEEINAVQVSLEGTKEIHNKITNTDSFDKTVNNIKKLLNNDINVFTNITLTQENYQNIEEYLKFLENMEIKEANITRFYPSGKGENGNFYIPPKKYAKIMKKIIKKEDNLDLNINFQGPLPYCFLEKYNVNLEKSPVCIAGKSEITIDPKGEIFPCPAWPESFGNVFEDSLESVWESTKMKKLRNNSLVCSKCEECEDVEGCGGGCLMACFKNGKDYYMVR